MVRECGSSRERRPLREPLQLGQTRAADVPQRSVRCSCATRSSVVPADFARAATICGSRDVEAGADLPAARRDVGRCRRTRAAAVARRYGATDRWSCSSGRTHASAPMSPASSKRVEPDVVAAVVEAHRAALAAAAIDVGAAPSRRAARAAPRAVRCARRSPARTPRRGTARRRARGRTARSSRRRSRASAAAGARAARGASPAATPARRRRHGNSALSTFTAACFSSGCFDCGQ